MMTTAFWLLFLMVWQIAYVDVESATVNVANAAQCAAYCKKIGCASHKFANGICEVSKVSIGRI